MIVGAMSYKQVFFLDLRLFNNDMLKAAERSKQQEKLDFVNCKFWLN